MFWAENEVVENGDTRYNSPLRYDVSPRSNNYSPHPRYRTGRPKPVLDMSAIRRMTYQPGPASPTKSEVIKFELHQTENQRAHHTEKYLPSIDKLVVRRGQPFRLDIKIRNFDFERGTDRIKLLFSSGDNAQESQGTLANVFVHSGEKACQRRNDVWKAYIHDVALDAIQVRVIAPPDAIVSAYKLTVKIFIKDENDEEKRYMTTLDKEIYLLFNPWCKDDQVYLPDAEDLDEYVLNDTGRVFTGEKGNIKGRPWVFGQFERCCVEAAFYVLNKSYLNKRAQGNVTLVTRALTAMANSCDNDGGILTGNWSGKYTGGTSPSAWNGSVAILEEYMVTKRDVKFGQCWVFSGLLTTLCRALGIPSRSVTNFESAHDKDISCTIDVHYNYDGEPLSYLNKESLWNFHVWNEGWFKRPDLPRGNDGWQAFDATPQEASEYMMRCGPAPVVAIKSGLVYLNYDTKFIFAEVNGDRVVWLMKPNGDMVPLKDHSDPMCVGKSISTKAVGSSDREDITHLYKHSEGSREEREAVERAMSFGSRKYDLEKLYENGVRDVAFKYEGECSPNGDIEIKLTATNNSSDPRTIMMKIKSAAMYYTGTVGENLTTSDQEIPLDPDQVETVKWKLSSESYLNLLDEDAKLTVFVTARVLDTHQFFAKNNTFTIDKPDLHLELSKQSVRVGGNIDVTIRFVNPVSTKLTQGVICLEGPGIQRNRKIPIHVEPGQEIRERITLTPHYAGTRELIACFNSRQLTDITGAITIRVTE